MHMEYKVTLPDHDFVFAVGHKLVPSVIGDMVVKKKCFSGDAVTYSGSTCVTIGSRKQTSSIAYHHLQDTKRIRLLEFESNFFIDGVGRPDENPRYEKTINSAVDYFCTYDPDALFICTNAPGRSAINYATKYG